MIINPISDNLRWVVLLACLQGYHEVNKYSAKDGCFRMKELASPSFLLWHRTSSHLFPPPFSVGRKWGGEPSLRRRREGGGGVATPHDGADVDGTEHSGGGNWSWLEGHIFFLYRMGQLFHRIEEPIDSLRENHPRVDVFFRYIYSNATYSRNS